MAKDPYEVLGVGKTATQDEIRTAYRKLAKQLHPDLNPGNSKAEDEFKAVTGAYDLVGDADKRGRYDRGEIDASGAERPPQPRYRDFHGAGQPESAYDSAGGFADFADDDIFADLFARRGGRANVRLRGQDVQYRLAVEFLEAVNGATKRLAMPDGATLDVTIPPGTRDGQTLRLRGKGGEGYGGGPPGDALIEVEVRPHAVFRREGDDIELDLPITLSEAVLGGKVTVPTPTGAVLATVPKNSSTGRRLRLRGKGVARADGTHGDEYVTLQVVLPEAPDAELEAFVRGWQAGKQQNPRAHLEEPG